jgi:hypothetical protein
MERSHARNHHRLPLVPNAESNRRGLSLGYLISCSFHPFRSNYTTQTTTLTAAGSVWLYAFVAAAQPKPTFITDGRYSSFGINDCEKVHRLTDSSSSPFQHLKSGPSQRQSLLLRTGSSHLTAHHPPLSHPSSIQTNPLLPALIRLPFVPSLPILFPKPSNPLPPLFPQRAKTQLPPLTSSQIKHLE